MSLENAKQEGKWKRGGEDCAFGTCWIWSEEMQLVKTQWVVTKKAESSAQQAFHTDIGINQEGKTGNTAFELTKKYLLPHYIFKD